MKLFKQQGRIILESDNDYYDLSVHEWDELYNKPQLLLYLTSFISEAIPISFERSDIQAPIQSQEVWASGVTYFRSKEGRQEESKEAGGGDFYEKVYHADRPELFFKATPARTVGPGEQVRIRKDSTWDVPEPELTLAINNEGKIIGYTIGNDMSSRSIEGENPLYLPQAKTYDGCAALGPCIYLTDEPLPLETMIHLKIIRAEAAIFQDTISVDQIKRKFEDLVSYLFRECSFPNGCYLMTGTGIVPPSDFTLQSGDQIEITIQPIGTLKNIVA